MAAISTGSALPAEMALSMSSALMDTGTILLQNPPAGLVVSTALRAEGFSAQKSGMFSTLSGCTAPIGTVLGAASSQLTQGPLPIALAAAAGAMVYVVGVEIIPEANASGNGNTATISCIGGLYLGMAVSGLQA